MGIVSTIVVFVIIWWLVFFTVLPYGNQPAKEVEHGHAESAPAKPRLWKKMLVTTGLTIILFGVFVYVREQGWISFRT